MPELPPIECPFCGRMVESMAYDSHRPPGGRTFEACLRQCIVCEIGFSNANTSDPSELTIIRVDPLKELPTEIAAGFLETLANAVNVVNRPSKLRSVHSSNSEDHVTWTVFRFLQVNRLLRDALASVGIGPAATAETEPAALFWGVPVPANDRRAARTQQRLMEVLKGLREVPRSHSEPDLILDFDRHGLVIIEAKLRSNNDRDAKNVPASGWDRYVGPHPSFEDPESARGSGLYQLARMWRIGWELAGGRPVTLVNLAPSRSFLGLASKNLDDFEGALATGPTRTFRRLGWSQLLSTVQGPPEWLVEYDRARGVSTGSARIRRDLISSGSSPTSQGELCEELTKAHDYLAQQGRIALEEASTIGPDGRWGTAVKREYVRLPNEGKPGLIPRSLKSHGLGEVVNQCVTLERLLDFLRWSQQAGSEFATFRAERCHPTTSSDKLDATVLDNDLILVGKAGERACFEVSDVASGSDGNRKLPKDLASLRVLVESKKGQYRPARRWPEARVFLIVSAEFAEGVLRRNYSWVQDGLFHFAGPLDVAKDTVLIEILEGRNREDPVGDPVP